MIALQAAAALCVIGAVKSLAPVCGKMLDLANGNQVPMKCRWAGQAALAIAIIILAAAVMALLAKKDYKGLMVVAAAAGGLLFLVFTSLIGVCASKVRSPVNEKTPRIRESLHVYRKNRDGNAIPV